MTEIDFDRLGDVWRQQPDPAEMARLQRTAAAVAKRARFAQIVDVGAGIAVAVAVIALALSNPSSETVVMGGAAILALLYSNVRLRRLRQVELRGLAGSTENMLAQSVERVETTLKHNRLTLFALGPGFLVGVLFAAAAVGRSSGSAIRETPLLRALLLGGGIAVLVLFGLVLMFAIRRGRRELERLKAMREAYRQERESATG